MKLEGRESSTNACAGQAPIHHLSDPCAVPCPPFAGGQGRTADEVTSSAFAWGACVVAAGWVLFLVWCAGGAS